MINLPVKILDPRTKLPSTAYEGDAGLDLYPIEQFSLQPGERKLVRTGIAIEIPERYEGQIRPRSGLAAYYGITVLNAPATIDCGYRGEIKVMLINLGNDTYPNREEAIAQLVIKPVCQIEMHLSYSLSVTERGAKGFGSSSVISNQ